MDTASRTKAMQDSVGIARVRTKRLAAAEHVELVAGYRPQERAFAEAEQAVAGQCGVGLAGDLEGHLAAVAAALQRRRALFGMVSRHFSRSSRTFRRTMFPVVPLEVAGLGQPARQARDWLYFAISWFISSSTSQHIRWRPYHPHRSPGGRSRMDIRRPAFPRHQPRPAGVQEPGARPGHPAAVPLALCGSLI